MEIEVQRNKRIIETVEVPEYFETDLKICKVEGDKVKQISKYGESYWDSHIDDVTIRFDSIKESNVQEFSYYRDKLINKLLSLT